MFTHAQDCPKGQVTALDEELSKDEKHSGGGGPRRSPL